MEEKKESTVKPKETELSLLVQKVKSTKVGNIIYYLKNKLDKDDKCILFSHYDYLLNKIGKLLSSEGIPVLYCTGTIFQRNNAIKNFTKNNNNNVIFLSSDVGQN